MNAFEKPCVTVLQGRYDELLRKEALLETIEKLHGCTTEYVFNDVVRHLFKTVAQEARDANG